MAVIHNSFSSLIVFPLTNIIGATHHHEATTLFGECPTEFVSLFRVITHMDGKQLLLVVLAIKTLIKFLVIAPLPVFSAEIISKSLVVDGSMRKELSHLSDPTDATIRNKQNVEVT